MAQIPQLERFRPSQTMPQNDRINIQAKDQGSQILQNTNAIAQLGETGAQMYQMYQNDKIEQISNVAEQEYVKWHDEQLTKLKSYQGDPTEAYAKFDEAVSQKKKDMLSSRAEFGEDVTSALNGRLDKVMSQRSIHADHQRGQQQEIYDNNVFESTVKLKRDGLAVNAGYIQKGDPTSFTMFDQNVADIKTTIAKRGIKQGTVTVLPENHDGPVSHVFQDDNGKTVKVSMSPMAKARMAKDLAEGVKGSLDVLISTGRVEEARELQKRYGGVLSPAQTAKLEAKYKTAGRKEEAFKIIGSLRGADEDVQIDKIENIQDPELRSEVLKIKDADTRRLENLRTRKEKANYDTLGSYVLEKMNSDQPFFGMADLENDPKFQATWDNMSFTQKKAIEQMVEAPKNSDPKVQAKLQQLMTGEIDVDFETMTSTDFTHEFLTGLSNKDKTAAFKWFQKQKNPSAAQERMGLKQTNRFLKDRLLKEGYEVDDEEVLDAQQKLTEYFASRTTVPNEKEQVDIAKKFAASAIDNKVFNPYTAKKKAPSQASATPNTINKNPEEILKKFTATEIVNFKGEFERKYKFTPKKADPRFLDFIANKKG